MIWGKKNESGFSAVSLLRSCGPLALIPVNGKKNEIGGAKFGPKNDCSARPWGRRAVTLVSKSFILVDCTGPSTSDLRDSAVYLRKIYFDYDPPKDAKTKWSLHGVYRHFRMFKVPTKADGGKPS